jgi:hypothetical protein
VTQLHTQLRGWNNSRNFTQFFQAELAGMFGTHIDGSRRPALHAATSTVKWTIHRVCRFTRASRTIQTNVDVEPSSTQLFQTIRSEDHSMSVRHSCRLSNRSTSLSARAATARCPAHSARAAFDGTPRLVRRRLVQLIHFAVGASAGGLMLGAHAQTSGNPCAGLSANICTIGAAGSPGTPGPKSGFDNSGNPGTGAGSAPALSATFSESSPTVFWSVGGVGNEPSAIGMLSIGGSGGNGSDASGGSSTAPPSLNLNGGDGGTAGAGGSVAFAITSGAQVQAIMSGPANLGAAGQAPAISVVSQGGAGGGGGVPSTGGTQGTSQIGGSAGDVTVEDMANPNQVNPLTGTTAAVIGFGSGIYAASVGGDGGTGNPHVTSFSKFGVDGADSDAPGGNVTVTTGTSIVGFANGRVGGTYPSDQGAGIWAVSAAATAARAARPERLRRAVRAARAALVRCAETSS